MKIDRRNPLHWYYLTLQAAFTLGAILIRPFLRRSTVPVVILYGHQISGHLAAIYSYWRTHEVPGLDLRFLTLNPSPVLTESVDGVDILHCQSFRDMMVVARASVMITDHGLHLMSPLTRLTDMTFIDVGHGIPFKGYDEQDFRLQHHYSEIWTSSRALSGFYENRCGCRNIVHSIGSPRTDRLIAGRQSKGESSFRRFLGVDQRMPLILYAPTWQQDDKGRPLIPFGRTEEEFFSLLSGFCVRHGCCLVIRSHQNASVGNTPHERLFFCPQVDYPDTEAVLAETDILISDWSSIVFDFLVLDRPTIFVDVPPPFAKGFSLGPEYRFGRITANMEELIEALGVYVQNPRAYLDAYADKHRSVKSYVYDDNADGQASKRCVERLLALLP